MPPSKDISFEEKVRLKHLFCLGTTAKEIAKKLCRASVNLQAYCIYQDPATGWAAATANGEALEKKAFQWRAGQQFEALYVQQFPIKTAKELKNEVPVWENMSVWYFQKILHKRLGMPVRKSAKKPLLTHKMKMKRLAFAKKYINLDQQTVDGCHVLRWVIIQDCHLQKCDGEEAKNHEQVQEQVHHPHRAARCRRHGLGLLQWKKLAGEEWVLR